MAVLIEAISVVINNRDLRGEKFRDGEHFKSIVPNNTLCSDNELMRVGFMSPDDVQAFIAILEQYGLVYLENGNAKDIVVVDQNHDFAVPCDWAEFGSVVLDGNRVAVCRIKNSEENILYTPEGWTYKDSLSNQHGFIPTEKKDERLLYLRTDGNVDVYLDAHTGEEVYVGRTRID